MKDRTTEARYRIYAVSLDFWNSLIDPVVDEQTWHAHGLQGHLTPMLKAEGIPKGAFAESVHHDWMNRTIMFRVWHESFDIVPDGERPPVVAVVSRVVLAELQTMIVRAV